MDHLPAPPKVLMNLDLGDPDAVVRILAEGTSANRDAACRRASLDVVSGPGQLVATGDLHDNPLHLARLVHAGNLADPESTAPRAHLTLHEIIHGDRLFHGMDFSFRVLARVAALKAAFPEFVHLLLGNHELAQFAPSAGIVKDGVRVVEAFNAGVEHAFHDDAPRVSQAINEFIRSMPLGLRVQLPSGQTLLCTHSLPAPELMDRFDPTILDREPTDDDYVPRRGAVHLLTWGRRHTSDQLTALGRLWNVDLFVIGHEKADDGVSVIEPNAVILNSDHELGVYARIPLDRPAPTPAQVAASVISLKHPHGHDPRPTP